MSEPRPRPIVSGHTLARVAPGPAEEQRTPTREELQALERRILAVARAGAHSKQGVARAFPALPKSDCDIEGCRVSTLSTRRPRRTPVLSRRASSFVNRPRTGVVRRLDRQAPRIVMLVVALILLVSGSWPLIGQPLTEVRGGPEGWYDISIRAIVWMASLAGIVSSVLVGVRSTAPLLPGWAPLVTRRQQTLLLVVHWTSYLYLGTLMGHWRLLLLGFASGAAHYTLAALRESTHRRWRDWALGGILLVGGTLSALLLGAAVGMALASGNDSALLFKVISLGLPFLLADLGGVLAGTIILGRLEADCPSLA